MRQRCRSTLCATRECHYGASFCIAEEGCPPAAGPEAYCGASLRLCLGGQLGRLTDADNVEGGHRAGEALERELARGNGLDGAFHLRI
jgi:hypothetical protein